VLREGTFRSIGFPTFWYFTIEFPCNLICTASVSFFVLLLLCMSLVLLHLENAVTQLLLLLERSL
jgi:hypothetical protein